MHTFSERIAHFPIMMFAIVMGFSGLTIAYEKATEFLALPAIFATILTSLDIFIASLITLIYLLKLVLFFENVKAEFTHPVRINFFAAVSISFLLLSVLFFNIQQDLSFILFLLGTSLHTLFTFITLSFWINKNIEINHSSPAWFIPIVGNVIVPIAGEAFVSHYFLMYYFSIGLFFWVILFAVLLNRIIFHNQMPQKFMPTFFIFIAPPSIGMVSYVKMFDTFDMFAVALLNIGLFFTFLLLFMYKNFLKLQFFISWWAFTFPLTAITIAVTLAFHKTGFVAYEYLAYLFLAASTLVVSYVALTTIKYMLKGQVCVAEH